LEGKTAKKGRLLQKKGIRRRFYRTKKGGTGSRKKGGKGWYGSRTKNDPVD